MQNPSIMSHVSLGTNNFTKARTFYEEVLGTIGAKIILEHGDAIAFGRQYPEFWLVTPLNDEPATIANGVHFGFFAHSKEEVTTFYEKAIELGATPDGPPGPRAEYGAPYFGCFVRDLDGHKIEATFWDSTLET